jgi:arginyl-tRNA synthetase
VRANNIFRKLEESGESPQDLAQADPNIGEYLAGDDEVWEIVHQAARLPEIVRQIAQSLELGQLCKYAFALAQKFNLFYHKHHILSERDAQKRQQLLLVADIVRRQLAEALHLLGCEVPLKM